MLLKAKKASSQLSKSGAPSQDLGVAILKGEHPGEQRPLSPQVGAALGQDLAPSCITTYLPPVLRQTFVPWRKPICPDSVPKYHVMLG